MEWNLFCEMKTNSSNDNHVSDISVDDIVPEWIDSELWKEVTCLETLPAFHGLKEAILSNSALWKEYFEVNVQYIDLINRAWFYLRAFSV